MSIVDSYYLPYYAPVFAFESENSKEIWAETVKEIRRDLSLALRLPHKEFWTLAAGNASFVPCLESYLRSARRPYDIWELDLDGETNASLQAIHRLVFGIFARFAEFRSCEISGKTSEDLLVFLVKRRVFDPSNILDLCTVYSNGSSAGAVHRLIRLLLRESAFALPLLKVL
ncbi:unnamed protein product, partial [Notodromas monacha]